jgi:hypothetical protein
MDVKIARDGAREVHDRVAAVAGDVESEQVEPVGDERSVGRAEIDVQVNGEIG